MRREKLESHRRSNLVQTAVLIAAMVAVLGLLGWLMAGVAGLIVAGVLAVASLTLSPRIAPRAMLRLYGARPLPPRSVPGLHELVDELADRADLDGTPELYYIPSAMLNAITVGRGEEASLGVTDGLLRELAPEELAGVLAHEIAHVANDDTQVMALADLVSQLTHAMSSFGKLLLLLNLPLLLAGAVTVPWSIVLVLLGAPVVSGLLQLALSRTREFHADMNAVRLTGDPEALARALKKLETYNESLMRHVLTPGYGRPGPSLLRTHPHTEKRIERLRELEEDERPEELNASASRDLEVDTSRVERPPRWRLRGLWY